MNLNLKLTSVILLATSLLFGVALANAQEQKKAEQQQDGAPANSEGAEEKLAQFPQFSQFSHKGQLLALPEKVTFNAHIRGIMSNTCFACHGPDAEESHETDMRLDSFDAAVEEHGVIEPGDSESSEVYQRLMDEDSPMPPADFLHQLSDYEKALFKKWIEQGAEYEQHWAYAPIRDFAPPNVTQHKELVRNPIDAFIMAKLEKEGVSAAARADKATLLRRLSLDLIGLPPTTQELQAYLDDASDRAYEKQVDRLLESPHYGERMAAFWLDLVRFSDTVGFHGDQNQRIFPYRDYVIKSLNSNQPFDQFTREQLGGDLLDNPTEEQLTATGLVRLNMVTREGGAQPEEYLAKYTADRVRMVGTAWLGATTGCCECHNHKYDPFSIEDFYSLGAFFDDVRQWGVYTSYGYTPNPDLAGFNNNSPFPPELRTASPSLHHQIQFLDRKLELAAAKLVDDKALKSDEFSAWLKQLASSDSADHWQPLKPDSIESNTKEQHQLLDDHSVLFTEKPKKAQQTKLTFSFTQPTILRSLRMEVLPDEKNNGFTGRGENGSFQSALEIRQIPRNAAPQTPVVVKPQYLRIELAGPEHLSLAEVQVFANVDGKLTNVALKGKATQSSVYPDGSAKFAIDGQTGGDRAGGTKITVTQQDTNAWWEVDLGKAHSIDNVVVWNRTDGGYYKRLTGYRLVLLDENRKTVFYDSPALPNPSTKIDIPDEFLPDGIPAPLQVAFAVADRSDPKSFLSGQPPRFLEPIWRSGPTRWQLPVDETKLKHTAVYNLNRAITVGPESELTVTVDSSDVGRIRFSASQVGRPVAGMSAVSDQLGAAVKQLKVNGNDLDLLTVAQRDAVKAAYYQQLTPYDKQATTIKQLGNAIADCNSGLAMTLISQPVAEDKMRKSRVLPRGDWQSKSGKPVEPNTPHFLPGYKENPKQRLTRLDLANWITSSENPMTTRHYVNRVWTQFFGTGLSNVIDDIGNQGEWPSHPQLMDWLATEFKQDWDRKKIVRLIVTSHTYQQQAAVNRELHERDPYNRLLGQQAARRLEAEAVRDNALAISGLLNKEWIGGPSVFPYQPPGYYSNLQFPGRTYGVDTDGRQYRRGVYMHWQRTFLHPMLTNFDAPSRDECVASRTQSNSPQQALTLLNDPAFVETSRALANRVLNESKSADINAWLNTGFKLAVSREPNKLETEGLTKMYQRQKEYFSENPKDAIAFDRVGQFQSSLAGVSPAEFAALGQVCRVILNLHETITRY